MFSVNVIDNNHTDITVIRGNTFREEVRICNNDRLAYIPCPGDQILFVVKTKYSDDTALLEKKIPYDTMLLELKASETANMRVGNWVYYIKLIRQNSDADTFIFGKFSVTDSM